MAVGVTQRANTDGSVDFLDNLGRTIFTVDPINRKLTMANGAILDVTAATSILALANAAILNAHLASGSVTASKLTTSLATGHIPLPLDRWRKVTTNDIPNIAAAGGLLAKDTDPIFERVNVATDKALRLRWAATSVIEITQNIELRANMDTTQPLTINAIAYMAGSADTPVIALGYWPGVGGANGGGNTGALSNAAALKSVSVAAPGSYPGEVAITLTPGAHGTDALYVLSTWCEYTKK
jgi:hypothetical protein